MPPDTQYSKTAVDKAKGIRYGLKDGKWVVIGRVQAPPSAPEKFATLFNQSATGSGNLPDLLKRINDYRYKLAYDTGGTLSDTLEDIGKIQQDAVNKYKWTDPKMYLAALPFIGPNVADLAEQKDWSTFLPKLAGMVAGLGIGSKLPEVAGEVPGAVTETLPNKLASGVRTGMREVSQVGEREVGIAEAAAKKEAAGKQAEFQTEASQRMAAARGTHEAEIAAREKSIAEKKAQHTKEVAAAKEKHGQQQEAAESKLAQSATKEASARLGNARLQQATKQLTGYRDRLVKDTVANIDKAEKAERSQLDARWNKFNDMIKSEKGSLSNVGDSVMRAERDDIKGSRENIKVFRDVLGRLKEHMIEGGDGTIKFLPDQMIGLDQLRGYWKELGDQIYNKELPGDVRKALQTVRDGVDAEIRKTLLDRYGKEAGGKLLSMYDTLKDDWSGYKRTWDDVSAVNPLPRIKRMLRDPAAVQEGIPVSERVAAILKGEGGMAVRKLLQQRARFGADPNNISKLMAVTQKLKDLPKMFQTVTETKVPKFPGEFQEPEEPKAPPEITEAKVSLPKAPETEPFNRQKFIREGLEKRIRSASNIGSGLGGFWALKDLLSGDPTSAAHMAEALAAMQGLKHVLTAPKVLDWLSEGGPVP